MVETLNYFICASQKQARDLVQDNDDDDDHASKTSKEHDDDEDESDEDMAEPPEEIRNTLTLTKN